MELSIPQEFKDYASRLLNENLYHGLMNALKEAPSASVRLNPFKPYLGGMSGCGINGVDAPVPWSSLGFYLKERPSFTYDPLFHAGTYYVQEAASMFLECAVRKYVTGPTVALDLCAAPGGKSTHLRSLLPEGSLLVCNEPIRNRAQVLAENTIKWGHPDVVVTNNYPEDFSSLTSFFDVLVTDVPCSGEGMFRKEEDAVTGWSMDNVKLCQGRQREILRQVWPALKAGGLLIYSTCTLNQYEDEENVAWIADELGAEVLPLDTEERWNVTGNLLGESACPVYHFIQGRTRGEGFFLAVLRKVGQAYAEDRAGMPAGKKKSKKKNDHSKAPLVPSLCKSWLRDADAFDFYVTDNLLTAIRKAFSSHLLQLQQTLKVMHSGVAVAELKGKCWAPSHALAMNMMLDQTQFCRVEVTYEQAIAYLRKDVVILPQATEKGFVLLTYQEAPLGFVKNIGSRANNLYPQEWKIRSTYPVTYSLKAGNPID